MSRPSTTLILVAVLATLPATSHAVFFDFFGEDLGLGENMRLLTHVNSDAARTAFLSNLTGVGTETFESYADGTGGPLGISFPGAGTATISGNGSIDTVVAGTNGFGRYPVSGTNYWESNTTFRIDFSVSIAAFGFYGVDVGDFTGQIRLIATNGHTVDYIIPNSTNVDGGGVMYYGFYDTENVYDSIEFSNTAMGVDVFGFDDFTIGTPDQLNPVPEPATTAVIGFALGLGLLASARRKLRSRGASS